MGVARPAPTHRSPSSNAVHIGLVFVDRWCVIADRTCVAVVDTFCDRLNTPYDDEEALVERGFPLSQDVGKRFLQAGQRLLAVRAVHEHIHAYFAGADQLEVDPGFGQRAEHANRDAGVRA